MTQRNQHKLLITARYILAFAMGAAPMMIGDLKDEWYTPCLIISNWVFQFGLATIQMWKYFKKLKQ